MGEVHQSLLRTLFYTAIIGLLFYRSVQYFTSELPPIGSGLKRLPGPISTLPYIGRVHDVDRMQAWHALQKFSNQYDGLFSCTLGGETHIWVAREDVAQDLLCKHAAISSARADLGAYPDVTKGNKYLPLLGYNETFHRQQRFAHATMTRGISNKFHGYIGLEIKKFIHDLTANPQHFYDLIHLFCARVSARLAYGSADSAPEHITNADQFLGQIGPSGPWTNLVPFLRHLPDWVVPGQRAVTLRQEKEEKLWKELFDSSKEAGRTKTYVSASLEAKASGESGKPLFENETEAKYAVGMLCTVAVFTIAGPATLFAMAMILHPEWQDKVRAEIDEVVGDEMLDLKHNPQLPILRAAIKECVRWKSTVPLGVPRLLDEDYSYDGYHFPAGAVVHVLDIALSQDATLYVDPDKYNPDRWLSASSPNYKGPLTVHPRLKGHHIFGRGKRACPGQDLAEAELLVFCGNLVKCFTLGPKVDEAGEKVWPDPERWSTNVIGGPLEFECDIRVRESMNKDLVEKKDPETAEENM
ncbi:cytochrome P450 oxidoreductase [Ophiobolus disseminans]|uniref:Cytochrome P450 oxidoreductase n=1 Tax=Ophiobolus disseminans TaxID=1469910 RepID=A0A6A6ZP90_9PLEO|nr:cytochrome P450 oxidoreductase [Ophiobolus disseminans]